MTKIKTLNNLRELYTSAKGRALSKELISLEKHSRNFINLSPFVIIGTSSKDGYGDVSPRGETPGFVKVINDEVIIIPDRPGNNRLDTLSNIVENPSVGMLFLIPGVDETLRINGRAEIRDNISLLEKCLVNGKIPKSVILVKIKQVYLHCAKSMIRSKIWQSKFHIDRSLLPSMNVMLSEQTEINGVIENEEETRKRYLDTLY